MATTAGAAHVLSLTPTLLDQLSAVELDDLVTAQNPDATYLCDDGTHDAVDEYVDTLHSHVDGPCIRPAFDARFRQLAINDVDIVVIPTTEHFDRAVDAATDRRQADRTTYVWTPTIDVTVDTTQLTTTLEPRDDIRSHWNQTTTPHVYVSSQLPAEYRYTWNDRLPIRGARPRDGDHGVEIPCLTCHPEQPITVDTVPHTRLGLRAIPGVGQKTASRLTAQGYATRRAVANATRTALQDIAGIGESTAHRIYDHARALEHGEVIRTSELPVPGDDPVFIAIETDGLAPTSIWQIGAYNAATDSYRSFLERDPDRKAGILQAFLSWYLAEADGQHLIAWNGWEFDFAHLHAFITEYLPEYGGVWDQIPKTDLYHWAVEQDNAILPGRTNALDDVSAALGYDPATTDFDERVVAEKYRAWSDADADVDTDAEPDWAQLRAYCEADVRALICVYDHLALEAREQAAPTAYDLTDT